MLPNIHRYFVYPRFVDFDLIRMLVLDLPCSILQRDLSNRVDQVLQKINPVLPKVSPKASTCFHLCVIV